MIIVFLSPCSYCVGRRPTGSSMLGWNKNTKIKNNQKPLGSLAEINNLKTICGRKSLYTSGASAIDLSLVSHSLFSLFSLSSSLFPSFPIILTPVSLTSGLLDFTKAYEIDLRDSISFTLSHRGWEVRRLGWGYKVVSGDKHSEWPEPLSPAFLPPFHASCVLGVTFRSRHLGGSPVYLVVEQNAHHVAPS